VVAALAGGMTPCYIRTVRDAKYLAGTVGIALVVFVIGLLFVTGRLPMSFLLTILVGGALGGVVAVLILALRRRR
jgi:hypothetical protein